MGGERAVEREERDAECGRGEGNERPREKDRRGVNMDCRLHFVETSKANLLPYTYHPPTTEKPPPNTIGVIDRSHTTE